MNSIVKAYNGHEMQFRDDGWFNATAAASRFAKDAKDWIAQLETAEYVCALADSLSSNSCSEQQFNEINDLYIGKTSSPAAKAKRIKLIKSTKLVKTKAGPQEHGGGVHVASDQEST